MTFILLFFIAHLAFSDDQNVNLDSFLVGAKPSPDLHSLILDYSPLQTPTAYAWNFFADAIVKFLSENVCALFFLFFKVIKYNLCAGFRR